MTNESIDRLARKLAESVPESLRAVRDDLEQNFRSVLRNGLARLDLVTREEFEVQEAILERAREQCAALETRLDALEAELARREPADVPDGSGAKKKAKRGKKTPPAGE